jgi:hypothetical protein
VWENNKWNSSIEVYGAIKGSSRYNEDVELSLRLIKKDLTPYFDYGNIVWHYDTRYQQRAYITQNLGAPTFEVCEPFNQLITYYSELEWVNQRAS